MRLTDASCNCKIYRLLLCPFASLHTVLEYYAHSLVFFAIHRSTLYDWLTNRLLVNVSTSQIPEPDIAVLPEDVLEKKKCREIPLKQRNETAQYSASKHMERNGKVEHN